MNPVEPQTPKLLSLGTGPDTEIDRNIRELRDRVVEFEHELADERRSYEMFIDAIPHLVWSADSDGNCDYVNERCQLYTGLSRRESLGYEWSRIIHPDDAGRTIKRWQVSVTTGAPYECEHRLRGKDGRFRWFISRALPRREEGHIVQWFGTATDIQDEKELQDRLKVSELRYRTLFDNTTEGFLLGEMIYDERGKPADFRHLMVNRGIPMRSGLRPEDLIGKTRSELAPALDDRIYETLARVAVAGEPTRHEVHNPDLDCDHELYAFSPAPGQFALIAHDITDRKRAEQALRENEERLKLAINSTDIGMFDFYPQTGRLIWSESTRRQFGLSADADVDYGVFLRGLHPDDRQRVDQIVQHAMRPENGGEYSAEYRTIGIEDGKERSGSAWGRVFFDSHGRAIRFIGVTLDVTDRKRAVERAEAAELVKRDQEIKSRFLDALAHQIKSPLASIKMAVTTLLSKESNVDVEQHHALLGIIDRSVDRLNTWSTETIQTASIEARIQHMKKERQDIEKALHDIVYELASEFEGTHLNVQTRLITGQVEFDRDMIKHVLRLLIDNACKYSPAGSPVVISYRLVADTTVLSIKDFGPGIPVEEQDRIFEKYYRGTAKRLNPSGTGLGLTIARNIVRAHGGDLWVVSEPGRGSTFHLSLSSAKDRV